jgi:hypothetical protein
LYFLSCAGVVHPGRSKYFGIFVLIQDRLLFHKLVSAGYRMEADLLHNLLFHLGLLLHHVPLFRQNQLLRHFLLC